MRDDQYAKLLNSFGINFDNTDKHFQKIEELVGAVGRLGGQPRDYYQEIIMLARKIICVEQWWITRVAKKTNFKLFNL